ncbi:beta-N-acetylhexosaminidase [Gammaproteobacteria bacterium]|nr:beta-N-acetylhexosaminidase [Gammaproteobacteria bacterium]
MNKFFLGRLMLDLDGTSLTQEENKLLLNQHVGGVILFARNISSRNQVQELCREIRQVNSGLLIAVDQEGGRVQRLKEGYTNLPSMQKLASFLNSDIDKNIPFATDLGWLMASEVIASGLDISFAPVLDLDDSRSSVIGDRSIGDNPERVIAIASAFIEGMNQAGMQATGKHFPGHGGIFADSHITFSQDTRSLSEIESHDLLPFNALKFQLGAIMTAHISFTNIDKEIATFSTFWLQEILRKKIGFSGIILSDDLSMKGSDYVGGIEAKVSKALDSGCNMVLICNDRPAALEAINFLEKEKISQSHKITRLKASQSISWSDLEKDSRRKDIIGKLNTLEK